MPQTRSSRILLWMCVLITVNQLGFGGIIPALALYARSFGVAQSAIGIAIAIYGLARFLVAMPAGQLADRVGRRPALAIGGLATAAGNLLCAYAPSFAVLVGARFVAGIGAGLVLVTGQIVLADISTPARRGRVMAIYHGVFLFAVGVGPLPGGILAERYGLRAPFFAYAVAGVVAAALAWMWIPETREARRRDGADSPSAFPSFGSQVRILTGHAGFMLVSLVSFMNAVARTGGLFNVIPVLAHDRLGLNADRIGLGLALASLVGLVLVYPSGVLVDRFGRKSVVVPATVLSAVSLLLFLLAPSYGWFLTACVVWSIATGVSGAAPAAYAADVSPPGMNAAAMSVYRMLADLGYVLGPLTLGLATDLAGANLTLAATAVLLAGSGLLFARYAPESLRPDRR